LVGKTQFKQWKCGVKTEGYLAGMGDAMVNKRTRRTGNNCNYNMKLNAWLNIETGTTS